MRNLSFIGLLLLFAASAEAADDEIDYSAPYVTLENGVLVTRYPNKAHEPTNEAPIDAAPALDEADTGPRPTVNSMVLMLSVALVAVWTWLRRRRMR